MRQRRTRFSADFPVRITQVETFTVSGGWKNWLFVRVHTDTGLYGIGEGTLNGFIKTTETAVHELAHLAVGQEPEHITRLAKRLLDSVSLDGGHIHRTAIAAIEVACWDILGKSLNVPIWRSSADGCATRFLATLTAGIGRNVRRGILSAPPRQS